MQRLLQVGNPAAIDLDRSRMQFHDIASIRDCGKISGKALFLFLHLDQPRLHACRCRTIGYGVDDVCDLPFENDKPFVDLLPIMPHLGVQALPLGMILSEEFRNRVRRE
ncbi:hypothetical protein [Aliihoeflea sp. 40Bstr573]|uniref:hypothetical protein n=1 Tax=Aliihoeflea sp. 40Bstr573 TaxID=2696467 RepID=UPI002094CDBB